MLKAIKIRLYPNKEQEHYMNRLLGCYRLVYNLCLEKKINEYTVNKKNLSLSDLGHYFHGELTKNGEREFLNEHNTKVLKQSTLNLMEAYKRFFVNGNGFPKYKSKKDNKQSARFPIEAISKKNIYSSKRLTLTKQLQNIRFECSNAYMGYLDKNKEGIKSATLSKTKSEKFFLSILIDGDLPKKMPEPKNDIIGLDIGIKSFLVDSKGVGYENLKLTRKNEKRISRLHRQLSNKQLGSKNRDKARKRLAIFQENLTNKKINYLHHITTSIVRDNQTIVIEDLNVSGMLKNHALARSVQELSIAEFVRQLQYKSQWYGRNFVQVDRFFPSSKLCHCCGFKNQNLKLEERKWKCLNCGVEHNRDLNAAINIEQEGERIMKNNIGHCLPELTPVDSPPMDDKRTKSSLKSSGWSKQENDSCTSLYKFR